MPFLKSLEDALKFADNAIQDGKVNLIVKDPVVEVDAEQAVKFAQPYMLALIAVVFVGVVLLMQKKVAI